MTAESKPYLFISYARSDDEDFVGRLHRDLLARGLCVWWDRESMNSRGITFLDEIQRAIESVDRVIAVIGPNAPKSDYVLYEWEYALLFGKAVVPILRQGDYREIAPELPGELLKVHGPDFREERRYDNALDELERIVREPVVELGPTRATPALPRGFVPRKGTIQEMQEALYAGIEHPKPVGSAVEQTLVLHGMGGSGKSVLAAAFARSIQTRRAANDGIVWLKVGQETNAASRLASLRLLGSSFDDDDRHYTEENLARSRLPQLLRDKGCLIVLDDVWSKKDVEPYLNALGPRCRLLVTTRDARLAVLGKSQPVDVLGEREALALLARSSGQPVGRMPFAAEEVARECGNLPLALAMIGGMVDGNPDRWEHALRRLRNLKLDKIGFELPNYEHPHLLAALQISVDDLNPDEQMRYVDLSVFPRGASIPEETLRILWEHKGVDPDDATDLVDQFVQRSLARRVVRGRIALHDLQFDYVRARAVDLRALHAGLLDAYAARSANGWPSGPNDGYFFDYLGYHLRQAGREEEWRALLISFPWLERKSTLRGFPSVLLDLAMYSGDPRIGRVYRVCRRAGHVLTNDPAQLAAQLLARLESTTELASLLEGAREFRDLSWLRPITASLGEEGEPTLVVFRGREVGGHAGTPRSIAVSSDGRLIASAGGSSNDLTVKIWSPESVRLLRSYEDAITVGGASALSFVGTDGRLAVAGQYGVRLYTLDAAESIAQLEFPDATISSLCGEDSTGTTFIGFTDGRVLAWDSTTSLTTELRSPDGRSVIAMASASASMRIALAIDSMLECRRSQDGQLIARVEQEVGGSGLFQPPSLVLVPDGTRVFFGSPPRSWTVGGGVTPLLDGTDFPPVVGFSEDGAVVIVRPPDDKQLVAMDTGSGRRISLIRNSREFSCASITRDGSLVVTADYEHDIKLWDLAQSGLEQPTWELRGPVLSVAIGDDKDRALVVTEQAEEEWDTATGTARTNEGEGEPAPIVRRGDPVPARHALTQVRSQIEEFLEVEPERIGYPRTEKPLGVLAVSLAANRAVSATLYLTKAYDGEEPAYPGGESGVPLALWELENTRHPRLLWGHMSGITCADITADGTRALTGSRGRILRLWNLNTGECLHVLRGHRGLVYACAMTDDGRLAVSSSEDMTVRLWDLVQGKLLFTFAASSAVRACDISRDSAVAVAGEISGRVHTFAVDGLLPA